MENSLDINDPEFMKHLLLDLLPELQKIQGQQEAVIFAMSSAMQLVDSASPAAVHMRQAMQEHLQASESLKPKPSQAHMDGLRWTTQQFLQALEPKKSQQQH